MTRLSLCYFPTFAELGPNYFKCFLPGLLFLHKQLLCCKWLHWPNNLCSQLPNCRLNELLVHSNDHLSCVIRQKFIFLFPTDLQSQSRSWIWLSCSLLQCQCKPFTFLFPFEYMSYFPFFYRSQQLFIAACQAPLSFTISQDLLKFLCFESVMVPNRLTLCCSLLLPSAFPSIRVSPHASALHIRWSVYWSFNISPSNEYSGSISFRIEWFDLLSVQGTLKSFLQHHNLKASIHWLLLKG